MAHNTEHNTELATAASVSVDDISGGDENDDGDDENVPPINNGIVNEIEEIAEDGGVEDKYLNQFFLRERNAINIAALRASSIFTHGQVWSKMPIPSCLALVLYLVLN